MLRPCRWLPSRRPIIISELDGVLGLTVAELPGPIVWRELAGGPTRVVVVPLGERGGGVRAAVGAAGVNMNAPRLLLSCVAGREGTLAVRCERPLGAGCARVVVPAVRGVAPRVVFGVAGETPVTLFLSMSDCNCPLVPRCERDAGFDVAAVEDGNCGR